MLSCGLLISWFFPSSASVTSSPEVHIEPVATEEDSDRSSKDDDDDDDEGTDDTEMRPKLDKGKAVMRGPPSEAEDEQQDAFLGPLNSNPPVHSAALNKRGSGWWADLPAPNPRHASLQLLPSQQTAADRNIHRQSLPCVAYRAVSNGSV